MGSAGDMDFTHVCKVYDHDFLRERERERERERGGGGDKRRQILYFPRVVNKHASAFFPFSPRPKRDEPTEDTHS